MSALDRAGHKLGVLFIDFRKAFDYVDHIILSEKPKAVGLAGDLWKWINDYLSLYLKKAGLASRNIVHLQKSILRCIGFCLHILYFICEAD